MTTYIVTVKLEHLKEHNPQNKLTSACRVSSNNTCTDSLGEHHSFLYVGMNNDTPNSVSQRFKILGFHVTRVEVV